MNKLSIRDKCILLALMLGIVTYLGYNFLWIPTNAKIAELRLQEQDLKGKIGDQTPLEKKIKELESENSKLASNIDSYRETQGGKSLNKEDFLVYLGQKCGENNTELIKFNNLGATDEGNGVWKTQFDFELRGTLSGINKVCEAIDNIGIRYSVGGMSLRQNDNFSYLTRFFDGISKLEWYKDETPEKEEAPADETMPEDNFVFPDEFYNVPNQQPQEAAPIPEIPQTPTPTPEPQQPQTPEPTPEPKDENITDRLNKLLELSAVSNGKYKITLLTNNSTYSEGLSSSDVMRLSITVQFIMYSDPNDLSNSFLYDKEVL